MIIGSTSIKHKLTGFLGWTATVDVTRMASGDEKRLPLDSKSPPTIEEPSFGAPVAVNFSELFTLSEKELQISARFPDKIQAVENKKSMKSDYTLSISGKRTKVAGFRVVKSFSDGRNCMEYARSINAIGKLNNQKLSSCVIYIKAAFTDRVNRGKHGNLKEWKG